MSHGCYSECGNLFGKKTRMDTETEKKRKRDEKPKHTKFEDSNSTVNDIHSFY